MNPDTLISPGYRDIQRQMHAAPRGYGQNGDKWADEVEALSMGLPAGPGAIVPSILDYGAGQGSLCRALMARQVACTLHQYDPAIPEWAAAPKPADLVVCTDVLEHVEEDRIDAVLDHLQALARRELFAVIALGPAGKTLPDGRNAHILLRPREWWMARLEARFRFERLVPCREHKELAGVWKARS